MNKIIAMIPARMGSKRIPKKNIRYMCGKPLINYPIDLCTNSGKFDSVWINTESEWLGKYAESQGISFHKRPPELANDTATNRDFVYQFLKEHDCDYVIMVNPTSPLLRKDTLCGFIDFVNRHDYDTVLSILSLKEETFFEGKPLNFSLSEKVNSQKLTPIETIVWSLTAWKRSSFIKNQENGFNPVFGGTIGKYVIPKDESCDLDEEEDWRIAEGILLSRESVTKKRYLDE